MILTITFENPFMLWGLLLLPILLILHLLNINRYVPVLFSDISLLKGLIKQRKRRLQLRKWLLLLLRSLILVSFVLGFANPYWSENMETKTEQEVVIVFDNHPYMQVKNKSGIPYIDLMKQKARETVFLFPKETTFSFLSNSTPNSHEILNRHSVQKVISEASFSFLTKSKDEFETEIYDLQQKAKTVLWFSNRIPPPILNGMKTFAPKVDFPETPPNISLDSAFVTNADITDQRNITLHIKVSNFSGKDLIDFPVKLFDRAILRNIFSISLPKNETQTFQFPLDFEMDKSFVGRVEIEDFPQTADNQYFINFGKNIKSNVLLLGRSNPYFEAVFDTEFSEFSHQSTNFNFNRIESSDIVIINEIDENFSRAIPSIKKLLEKGGKLCVFSQKNLGVLNTQMQRLNLPTFGKEWKNNELKMEYNKAFFRDVILPARELEALPEIERGLKIETRGQYLNHILTLGNIPVLTEVRTSKGKAYLFATKNRTFFEHSLFSPLMFRITITHGGAINQDVYEIVRTPSFRFVSEKNFTGGGIELTHLEENLTINGVVLQNINRNIDCFLPVETLIPGNYDITSNNKTTGIISFNTKRIENFSHSESSKKPISASPGVAKSFERKNFGHWFFVLAILILFIEGYISKK